MSESNPQRSSDETNSPSGVIWDDPRITAYVLGELPDEQRSEFERSLGDDEALSAAVEQARSVTGKLSELFAAESMPPLDSDRRTKILSPESLSPDSAGPANDSSDSTVNDSTRSTVAPLVTGEPSSMRLPLLLLTTAAGLLLLVGLPMYGLPKFLSTDGERVSSVIDADEMQDTPAVPRPAASTEAESGSVNTSNETASLKSSSASDRVALSLRDSQSEIAYTESQAIPAERSSLEGLDSLEMAEVDAVKMSIAKPSAQSSRPMDGSGVTVPESSIAAPSPVSPHPFSQSPSGSIDGLATADSFSRGKVPSNAAPSRRAAMVPSVRGAQTGAPLPESNKTPTPLSVAVPAAPSSNAKADVELFSASLEASDSDSSKMKTELARGGARGGVELNESLAKNIEAKKKSDALMLMVKPRIIVSEEEESPFGIPDPRGMGPGRPGDRFDPITENEFKRVSDEAYSTFSIDVDTASYSKVRDVLVRSNSLPRPDMVRIEELVNYFDYDYTAPAAESPHPFEANMSIASCPWNPKHRLARIAIQGKTMKPAERPPCNLVFLLDTSGSMDAPNKLPLVIDGMKMLAEQLDKRDTISIVVYAGSAGLVLDATSAKKIRKINKALTQLSAGGSTNGGAGIQLAYQTAKEHFIKGGVNRLILCTDGDFNVGTTSTDALVRMVEQEAKGGVFLTVLGFGMGNHNDAMLEKISGRGNGNYAFIDTINEAKKVLVDQTNGTLVTIAKDVKIQVVFNQEKVSEYRLIGYENRMLAKEDFNDDRKDAGEIGAGHQVTALYELVPKGVTNDASPPPVDESPYQTKPEPTAAAMTDEVLTLKLRYKQPDEDVSTKIEFAVKDEGKSFDQADADVRFAAAVAGFGMKLRRSQFVGTWTFDDVIRVAEDSLGEDRFGLRNEFIDLARRARELTVRE